MNDNISDLRKTLNLLDCTQESIQKASGEFLKIVIRDETRMEDLVKLWKFFSLNKPNKLAFVYLANDIIQNSFFQNLKFHDVFLNHINDTFPQLYKIANDKFRKEIIRMIDIWTERKIYSETQMENLKKFLCVTTIPNADTVENPLLENYLKTNKIKVSERIKEFANNLDNFVKCEDKINRIRNSTSHNNQNNFNKNNESAELKKIQLNQHKNRETLLKNSADLIKKQNQVYFKHICYLQEVDKLLEKINSFKAIHKNTDNQMQNNNINGTTNSTNYNMALNK